METSRALRGSKSEVGGETEIPGRVGPMDHLPLDHGRRVRVRVDSTVLPLLDIVTCWGCLALVHRNPIQPSLPQALGTYLVLGSLGDRYRM